jgi:hemoglobin
MTDLLDTHLYALLGEAYFTQLTAAFYRRVALDDLLGAMYPKDDMANAEVRLRDFLIQRFGGPQTYSQQRGHPRLRMRHAAFHIDQAARDRWIELMTGALNEVQTPATARPLLDRFFSDAATFMINRSS